jgi:tRNA pseudouridine38-40 synthase
MPRFFIEVSYHGASYSGFQVQENANTIQAEVERALAIYFRLKVETTGSSRTDAGVHAHQNYFHFDIPLKNEQVQASLYGLNAILPDDISVRRIIEVADHAHCRFDAKSRTYKYIIYQDKSPFLLDRGYHYPYPLQLERLNDAAKLLMQYNDFQTFSKKHVQVKDFNCKLYESEWQMEEEGQIVYRVKGNRFLRGMVRGLVGTMLKVGNGKLSIEEFREIIEGRNQMKADFSTPGKGLILLEVEYDVEKIKKK